MIQEDVGKLTIYRFRNLVAHREIRHFISGRHGGVSVPPYDSLNLGYHVGDSRESVLENRRRLASAVNVPLTNFVFCKQVHRGDVTLVTEEMRGRGVLTESTSIDATDAMVTDATELALTVLLADCVPVIMYDPVRKILGVAHAGWRGTVRSVASNTVAAMKKHFDSDPADVLVGIGPSIGPDAYEVGPEVAQEVRVRLPHVAARVIKPGKGDRFLFDLWEANRAELIEGGVKEENIELAEICTLRSTERFFSERGQRPTGRFCASIVKSSD